MTDEHPDSCTRRRFICGALRGAALCAAGGSVLGGVACATVPQVDAELTSDRRLTVEADAFEEERDGLLAFHPKITNPIYVHRTPDDAGYTYTAVSTTCTHRGCRAEPTTDRIICPCHGSEFSHDGALLDGPAGEPLVEFPIERTGDYLVIRLDQRM